jgi:hypothetical protein
VSCIRGRLERLIEVVAVKMPPHRVTPWDTTVDGLFWNPVKEFWSTTVHPEGKRLPRAGGGVYVDRVLGGAVSDATSLVLPPAPEVPFYGRRAAEIPRWKIPATYQSVVPLKLVSPNRLNLTVLAELGATEIRLLGPEMLGYVDSEKVKKVHQSSSPCLTKAGSPYVAQLTAFGWAERPPVGTNLREQVLMNRAFPVLKDGGMSTRWVVDCGLNHASDAPTAVMFPRLEHVHDYFLWYAGGREDDAVSFYGQFALHKSLRRFFAFGCGVLTLWMCVMAQGWAPATRIAQEALMVMYRAAHDQTLCATKMITPTTTAMPAFYFAGYVDNALTLSQSKEDDRKLRTAVEAIHKRCNADFLYGEWSTAVSFVGMIMTTARGSKYVELKKTWATRARDFLSDAADRAVVTLEAKRQLIGVALWAARVLRHALAEIDALIEWIRRGPDDVDISVEIRQALKRVVRWMTIPRALIVRQHFRYVAVAAVDATPECVAACVWEPISLSSDDVSACVDVADRDYSPVQCLVLDAFVRFLRFTSSAVVVSHLVGSRRDINGMELVSLLLAVILAPPSGLLLILTDSMVAKAWSRRGLSNSAWSTKIVALIAATARRKNLRLFLAHVRSELNPADKYTRTRRDVQGVVKDDGLLGVPLPALSELQVTAWL